MCIFKVLLQKTVIVTQVKNKFVLYNGVIKFPQLSWESDNFKDGASLA